MKSTLQEEYIIMPVTIKDIALRANVSYQAVSAVLNNKTNCRVSPQKREHIRNIARELGYQVNFGYKLMHGRSTHTVAIVSAMLRIDSEEHIKKMVLKLIRKLNLQGFSTYFTNMTENAQENLLRIRVNQRTFIGWNSLFRRNLNADSTSASVRLLSFLKEESGEIPVLLLPGKESLSSARFKALEKVAGDPAVDKVIENHVIFTRSLEWDEKDFEAKAFKLGYEGTAEIFAKNKDVRSIAYFTDNFALGGIVWCHENHIAVGKDVFVSGFNNIEAVRFNPYPVASAEHPVDESIEILLEKMMTDDDFSQTIPLKVFLRPSEIFAEH